MITDSRTVERRRRLRAALLVCAVLAAASGCSTDDSVGNLQPSCIVFTPEKELDLESGAEEIVAEWGAESTCDTAEIELYYTGSMHPVWGASFTIEYPSAFAFFPFAGAVEVEDGFLFEDGVAPIVDYQEVVAGRIVVGITRTDSSINAGVSPTPDNRLLARLLFFRAANSGEGDVIFTDANVEVVENPGDIPAEAVPAVPFFGGSFTIEN